MNSLGHFYLLLGHYQDGEKATRLTVDILTEDKLEERQSVDAQRLLAKSLIWQANFSTGMGRLEMAEQCLQKCASTLDSPGLADKDTGPERAFLLKQRGWLADQTDHLEESKQWFEQSLALLK